jgi:hypothetical protein
MALLKHFRRFHYSKRALALPLTFLMLLVSTLGIISFTYYYSVQRVEAQSQVLQVSTAKENMISLDDTLIRTLGQPGSSGTFDLADSGGMIRIQPDSNVLTLSVSGGSEIEQEIFNASVGRIIYELPSSSTPAGLYLKGDSRSITNQSGASMTQLCMQNGEEHPEIQLRYRPSVTSTVAGLEDGKAQNIIRIYLVNLNSSSLIALMGKLPLQITCKSTQLCSETYQVSSAVSHLVVYATLDGASGSVSVPITTKDLGAVIHVEMVISNVSIGRWIR